MRNIADIFVESRIDGHVFGTHGEPLPMLILVLNVEDEGDARRILAHHFFQEGRGKVDPLNDQGLVPLVV